MMTKVEAIEALEGICDAKLLRIYAYIPPVRDRIIQSPMGALIHAHNP